MGVARLVLGVALLWTLAGCGHEPAPRLDLAEPLPEKLSDVGVLSRDRSRLRPVSGFAYDLGHPLFSDYASKYRTLHLPAGSVARPGRNGGVLQFPVGTVITKTFYYPSAGDDQIALRLAPGVATPDAPLMTAALTLLETRVLRHQSDGWEAVAYRWNGAQTEAFRTVAGALVRLSADSGEAFDYLVPDRNQCAACHAGGRDNRLLQPLGPKPANLAAWRLADGGDQYAQLVAAGHIEDAGRPEPWPVDASPRPYLDVNCSHCHSGAGAAASSGLDLGASADPVRMGLCKPPVAAGRGSGGLAVGIWPGRPEVSILVHRMRHDDPAVMMPELGRSLIHAEGVALVEAWIDDLEGDCDLGGLL